MVCIFSVQTVWQEEAVFGYPLLRRLSRSFAFPTVACGIQIVLKCFFSWGSRNW
jgi:hypothetical protein